VADYDKMIHVCTFYSRRLRLGRVL